jgi:uncharacterized YigZ family protein
LLRYKTIKSESTAQLVIKKSTFIAHIKPIATEQEAIEFISLINTKHRDARHNVYAYVLGDNYEVKRYSDDGEPQGTAGIPMLDLLVNEDLKNVVVVVTRYFGGVLLGTGGLVRAYTSTTKLGLEEAGITLKILCKKFKININYDLLGKIQNKLLAHSAIIEGIEYTDKVSITFLSEIANIEKIEKDITEITLGKVCMDELEHVYIDKI